ncbi:LPXTG cell wall anchor domain-containing protein, partial [Herbiconiux daphne]
TESAKTQQAVSKLIAQSTERNTLPKTGESSIVGTILTNIGIGLVVLVGGAWLVLFKKGRHQK